MASDVSPSAITVGPPLPESSLAVPQAYCSRTDVWILDVNITSLSELVALREHEHRLPPIFQPASACAKLGRNAELPTQCRILFQDV